MNRHLLPCRVVGLVALIIGGLGIGAIWEGTAGSSWLTRNAIAAEPSRPAEGPVVPAQASKPEPPPAEIVPLSAGSRGYSE